MARLVSASLLLAIVALTKYCIALIFRGSKFSLIAVFYFVELISRMRCFYVANVAQLRSVKIFAEIISRTIPNSRNSQN